MKKILVALLLLIVMVSNASAWSERVFFSPNTNTITGVKGAINPVVFYNGGSSQCSDPLGVYFDGFNEQEFYLKSDGTEGIEIVAKFTGWCDGLKSYNTIIEIIDEDVHYEAVNVQHGSSSTPEMNYEIYLDNGKYTVKLQNPYTGQWYTHTHDDTDNPSYNIITAAGSTEFGTYASGNPYTLQTAPITANWVRDGSSWVRPNQKFSYATTQSSPYVVTTWYWGGDGSLNTAHTACNTC